MSSELGRLRAAKALAAGSTQAAAARAAGVDRATIGRWLKDDAFKDLILRADKDMEEATPDEAAKGLTARVEKALTVIDEALAGGHVSPQLARIALDVIKAAKTFEPKAAADQGPSTLTTLIAELDKREAGTGND